MKHILFLFPIVKNLPTGGLKVVYDYANRLTEDGHQVTIAYAAYFASTNRTIRQKLKAVAKYIYVKWKLRHSGYTWHDKKQQVVEKFVWEFSYSSVPKADAYVATAVCTAPYVNQFPVEETKKFYFIQGYESFIVPNDDFIKWTYRLPLRKIVISRWLSHLITDEGENCVVVPNGFESSVYKLTIPIEKKNKYLASMLYHINESKDIGVGKKAVALARKRIPQLRLLMFGAYPQPENLPAWITYYKEPSLNQHLEINNQAAVYIGCSKIEGWGLTVGEAMMCGQAVACTDNDGYKEMAVNGVNALISPIGDVEALAENIVKLINNDRLRYDLAKKGMETIKAFDFEKSYRKFCEVIMN